MRSFATMGLFLLALAALADDQPLVGGHAKPDENKQDKSQAEKKQRDKKTEKMGAAEKQAARKKAADKPVKAGKHANKSKAADADREEAALLFVREHQPELVELLNRLKGTKEKEYQQAIKELSRDSQRIDGLKQRDPERYQQDVRAWQLDSQIRLLTAKLSLEDRPELREDLKAALAERADLRLAQRKLERERVAARLAKLDEDIAQIVSQRDEDLKRTFDRLLRAAERVRPKAKKEGTK
ncbi:MAG TPA: hypothetical protein VNH11_21200 [Pirellulales bacterium]|nr:hypothetical protein [Pirellulales bacterium]